VAAATAVALAIAAPLPAAAQTTPSPEPSAAVLQELVATPAVGPVGTESLVQLRGWPAGATVQISTCGNNALNGNADCDNAGSISATTDDSGAFTGRTRFSKPPKPCPCVLYAFSTQSRLGNRFPIELTGYPTAPTSADGGTRKLDVRAEIEGGGPLASWFGGAAERTLVLVAANTGSLPIENPPTVVTYGRGEDPTDLLVRPELGAIAPGQTSEIRIPFELPAGSFGSYTVKTTIGGLDQPTAARASTSTYPWFLLVGVWLLIQIPLLGLHKRRVDDGELFDESELLELDDPFRGLVPGAATGLAAGAAVAAGAATAVLDRPGAAPPPDSGLPAWAAAAVAPEAAESAAPATPAVPVTPAGAPSAVAAIAAAMGGAALAGAGAAAATSDAGGAGRGGYGVDHLLGIVSPGTATPPPATVAARVVVAGTTPKR
jgi:hypothetical protein